jgi:hypothetical protein
MQFSSLEFDELVERSDVIKRLLDIDGLQQIFRP